MKKIILPIIILSSSSGLLHAQASTNENYVQSTTYIDYPAGQAAKKAVSVQYFDGLGRPKQTVSVQATPQGRDVVSHIVYDAFGRVANEYLPVPQGGTQNGAIYPDPLSNLTGTPYGNEKIYSEKLLESSPLDRVLEQKQPGTAWNDKPVKFEYGTNTGTEVKKYGVTTTWSYGATNSSIAAPVDYGANQLYKTTVTDEDGNATTEFKNTKGQVILVRKALSDTQNADTYYLYNEYDQLAAVIPPKAVPLNISQLTLDDLCYQYSYDGRNRLAGKKVPGKGWEYMVYDKQDRLVMTQDAELGKASQWLFTKYDAFGRPVYTGMYTGTQAYGPQGRAAEQANVETKGSNNESRGGSSPDASVASLNYNNAAYPASNIKILTINYYDTFPRDPYFPNDLPDTILNQKVIINSQSGNVKGLLLASYVKNIENDDWTRNFMLYDPKGRLIGSRSINHLGGSTHIDMKLNFAGLTEQSITRHKRLSTDTEKVITENFTYDHQNRPLVHKHKVDNNAEEILSQNKYNELSQLEQKKVGGINPGSPLQTINYQYNIRGWMTGINDPANLGNDLFGYKIKYNQVEGMENPNNDFMELKVKPKYNGNIAEVDWKTATASNDYTRRYGYVYDKLNRMLAGFYQRDNNPSGKEFFEKLDYDLNGNIERLKRSSDASTGNPTTLYIDDLTYVNEGNRLKTVTDASTNYNGYPDASGNAIAYDLNGNMIDHKDKGILQIKYNYLSLPDHQTFDQTYIVRNFFGGKTETRNITTKYLYAADGTKLKKTYTYGVSKNNSEAATVTDYLDGFQYEGQGILTSIVPQILKFIPTSEGYYNFENNKYIYNYTDHLGNVRLSYMNSSTGLEVIEESNYYPFGLKHQGYNALAGNPAYQYQYNGKELQKESGMYDYGARMYMPDLGRWGVVDPLAEKMTRHSPYNYVFNNPLRFIDPDGRQGTDWVGTTNASGSTSWKWDENIKSAEQAKAANYDDYRAPGSIIDNGTINGEAGTDGKTSVYLGENANDVSFAYPNSTVTPFQVGTEWLSGTGPRNRNFTNGDVFTEMLKQHSHVEDTRNTIIDNAANGGKLFGDSPYRLGGIKGVGLYLKDYSTLLTGGLTGNLAVTYLGSYNLNWTATPNYENCTIGVNFSVNNTSTMQSASRPPVLGYLPGWQNTVGSRINTAFQSGWGSKTSQSFNWTETLPMR